MQEIYNIMYLICKENKKEDKKNINIFISQLLSQIAFPNEFTERLYLILDEIGMFGKIYELPRNIQIARTRKVSISILTDKLGRLSQVYGDEVYTILNCIDTQLFLGTNLKSDIEYFSDLLGIDNEFIKNDLERDKLLIYEKGLKPIIAEKDYYFNNEKWRF